MIEQLRTWKLIDRPPNTNIIGRKWVFKIKHGSSGKIMKYKAQLVVQGFTQVPRIDYTNIFAPVTKFDSLCALLAMAAWNNWEIYQMDVKNAYLNGVLKEEIFMEQPPGFITPKDAQKVCYLFKPIYRLKQLGRGWYKRLCEVFYGLGFTHCLVDHGMFYKQVTKTF